ncbi:MAG TPA: response regulator [Gemmatimonadales bacterium]|nr:response regulator [Gemmatimonadales bacterium]
MRVLLVDDEAPARLKLSRMLAADDGFQVVGEASHGAIAVSRIRALRPELVFLDIQMPVLDGFGVIEQVGPEAMPPVVFVTAFEEHALRAFEVHALDYLLKPITPDRLRTCLTRIRAWAASGPDGQIPLADRLRSLLRETGHEQYLSRLLVPEGDREHLLPVARISHFEADRNYIHVRADSATYEIRGTLTDIERRLDPREFLRTSRSTIVRLDAIRELIPAAHGDCQVVLHDGTRLVWTRRYRARGLGSFSFHQARTDR